MVEAERPSGQVPWDPYKQSSPVSALDFPRSESQAKMSTVKFSARHQIVFATKERFICSEFLHQSVTELHVIFQSLRSAP